MAFFMPSIGKKYSKTLVGEQAWRSKYFCKVTFFNLQYSEINLKERNLD
jgi:hypothetical protein